MDGDARAAASASAQPSGVPGVVLAGRVQILQDAAQWPCMYLGRRRSSAEAERLTGRGTARPGLASHSPTDAHSPHMLSRSKQPPVQAGDSPASRASPPAQDSQETGQWACM